MATPKTRAPKASKTSRSAKTSRAAASVPPASPASTDSPKKGSKTLPLLLLGAALLGLVLFVLLKKPDQGPEIPLPRVAAACQLGAPRVELEKALPKMKLRPYNNDPDFKIVSLKAQDGLTGDLTALDLIFFKDTLFFVSQQWSTTDPQKDMEALAHEYRRWAKAGSGQPQNLGEGATLREWRFQDASTEMLLRELTYNERVERWQDLRDGTNAEAVKAFEKYRIDG